MPATQQRDEKTLEIASALGVFCLVLGIGAVGSWCVGLVLDLGGAAHTRLFYGAVVAAAAVTVGYLVRAGDPDNG